MSRVAPQRVHTGTFHGDQIQRTAQQAARKVNEVAESAEDHETRITALERLSEGMVSVIMGDASYTATAEQMGYQLIQFTGAHTAARTFTMPRATADTAYLRWVSNATTGGFAITLSANGSTVSLGSGLTRLVFVGAGAPAFLV